MLAQRSVHTVWDDTDSDQWHSGTLAEGQQVEEGRGMCGRLEGVKQVQQEQRADDASCFDQRAAALFGFGVEGGVQAQTQAKQRAHVAQEAGKGRGVQVDPLWSDAPLLRFLHGPQQVHTQSFEQHIEANSEGGEEQSRVEILLHAGAVDPLSSVKGLSHNHT